MSGGSYNYLCFHGDALSEHRGDLEAMARRLEGLPWAAQAAAATRECLRNLAGAEQLAAALSEVWRAVEWWDSGDWGEASVRREVDAFTHPQGRRVQDVAYRLVDVGGSVYELRPLLGEGDADG